MAAAVQLQGAVFDPAATHVMGEAFDCACRSLRGIGQVGSVREIIAKRIIKVAREGERDPDRLCNYALHGLDFFYSVALGAGGVILDASPVAGSLTAMFDMFTNLMLDTSGCIAGRANRRATSDQDSCSVALMEVADVLLSGGVRCSA
jgi:hypothetical protein